MTFITLRKYHRYAIAVSKWLINICLMQLSKEELSLVIGQRIRKIRLDKKMSIEKLAHEAGIEYTQLSRIELGKINTSIYHIYIITLTLGVEMQDLFDGIHSKPANIKKKGK